MLKHNQHQQITFSICSFGGYNSRITSKVNDFRVKSPIKANTDHHNDDLKMTVFSFSGSARYHQASSMMAIKKRVLNSSLTSVCFSDIFV